MAVKKVVGKELGLLLGGLKDAFSLFRKNDPLRMAGATAFFTTFALPPIVFILAQVIGLFIGAGEAGRGLINSISETLGKDGAEQIRQVIKSIRGFSDSWYIIGFGILFLVFIATTLFSVIKNSLNQIWKIHIKEKPWLLFLLSIRARSFAVILVSGILFFTDLLLESIEIIASDYVDRLWQGSGTYFKSILAQGGSVVIVTVWFIILFRFLADGRPGWKVSAIGGLLTGILFIGGRFLLRFLLVDSDAGKLYGPAGSFVLLLLFVFYSSFILYYGASFISVYSQKKSWPIIPNEKAFNYRIEKIK